jgi:hypothetical protein
MESRKMEQYGAEWRAEWRVEEWSAAASQYGGEILEFERDQAQDRLSSLYN